MSVDSYGQLRADFFPLAAFGLSEAYPELASLQAEVADLDARRIAAEADVGCLKQEVQAASGQDRDAEAKAIRVGKAAPKPVHEAKAKEKLARAEQEAEALLRAVNFAAADLAALQREQAGAFVRDLAAAERKDGRLLGEQASGTLATYSRILEAQAARRRYAPPAPAPDENRPAENIFLVAHAPLANAGPQRGEVEAVLGHLAGLAAAVPAEPDKEQADDAA